MRSIFVTLPASLFLLASHAGAQEQISPPADPQTSSVQVTGPSRGFQFFEQQADEISGAYAMANGWRLKVDSTRDGIVATIDKRPTRLMADAARHPEIELVAVGPDRYVTRDGNISMEFNRGTRGDDMLMSYVPDARTAQVVTVAATAMLAQR